MDTGGDVELIVGAVLCIGLLVGMAALGGLAALLAPWFLRTYRPFWCWPATVAYPVAVVAAGRALVEAGGDLHAPACGVPFALGGLAFGLGLTLLERLERGGVNGPKGSGRE